MPPILYIFYCLGHWLSKEHLRRRDHSGVGVTQIIEHGHNFLKSFGSILSLISSYHVLLQLKWPVMTIEGVIHKGLSCRRYDSCKKLISASVYDSTSSVLNRARTDDSPGLHEGLLRGVHFWQARGRQPNRRGHHVSAILPVGTRIKNLETYRNTRGPPSLAKAPPTVSDSAHATAAPFKSPFDTASLRSARSLFAVRSKGARQ